MSQKAIHAILGLCLAAIPAVTGAQDAYRLPPPRISCDAASGVVDQAGQRVEGGVRKRCDALWAQSMKVGGVGGWRYDDFMSQCGQSCPAPKTVSQQTSVPQLNTLGTQAAQSVTTGAGGGFNTALLVGGGIAAAVGIGFAASHHSPGPHDQPASP